MDKILDEHCRDAGVSTNHVSPALNAAEIVELREFAEKMPYVSRIRRVFNDAAQQAERRLQEGAPEMAHSNQEITPHPMTAHGEQSPSHTTTDIQRCFRDSVSRGR